MVSWSENYSRVVFVFVFLMICLSENEMFCYPMVLLQLSWGTPFGVSPNVCIWKFNEKPYECTFNMMHHQEWNDNVFDSIEKTKYIKVFHNFTIYLKNMFCNFSFNVHSCFSINFLLWKLFFSFSFSNVLTPTLFYHYFYFISIY